MNALELLATLGERGATARAEIGGDGAAVLVVAPREAIGDLLPELQRFKPQLLELLAPTGNAPTGTATANADGAGDARALELLARYRRGGAALELEEIEHAGAAWLALACDLTDVAPEQRGRAFAQIERNAPQLRRALDLEAAVKPLAARAPVVKVAGNSEGGGGVAAVIGCAEVSA